MRSVGPWGVDGVSGRHSSSTPEHSCHSGLPPPPVETQPDHNLLPSGVVVNKIVMSSDNRLVSKLQISQAFFGQFSGKLRVVDLPEN